jgi:tetratricopeptide (TPR) repeat protein
MGVVFRALDRRTGRLAALKTMQYRDAKALEFFKGEFRYLQGVSHPNLVQLYDLESDGHEWLLTMELVEGVDFLSHVRPGVELLEQKDGIVSIDTAPTGPYAKGAAATCGLPPLHVDRLRKALGQLTEGIAALHAHQRIHRDLKPGNVRVTPEGRVVILDFGLATDLDATGEHPHTSEGMLGTVPYMAPEQGREPPVSSPASDWYSVGVILYKALTGRHPFTGSALKVMRDKLAVDPPAPRDLCPDVPEDLDKLCRALLRRQPGDRTTGAEILDLLRCAPTARQAKASAGVEAPLLGREQHLRSLEEAYAASRQRRAVVVAVHGPSGIGKSALVRHFLERLRGRGAVVLAGRCYEHESVPYKALDPLVDELGRYLRGLPAYEVEARLPRDIGPLVRVFPVLGRVGAVSKAAARSITFSDPQEVRRRAFAGLREMLARVGDRQPLVLHIDDLQWGDVDSAHLLADMLQPPDPPPLLLLTSYRSEDAGSTCLRALTQALGRGAAIDRRELTVAPLSESETRELVLKLLKDGAEQRAAQIARESGGNPFFITELVQEIQSGDKRDAAIPSQGENTLERLIRARVERLPVGARRLLEVVAVSGRPLRDLEAYQAAEVGTDGRVLLARLESARFLRGTGSAEEDCLETYHDRIRETVVAALPSEPLRRHHHRLAQVLEKSGRAGPEELAVHFEGAGEAENAGVYYAKAAGQAAEAVAFDQAANLYRRSLELRPVTGAAGRELRTKLGDALANGGRGAEAGPVFLAAAGAAEAMEALELRRRAAGAFLFSGYTREGLDVLQNVLSAVGLRLFERPQRALLAMLMERARLRVRGLDFHERADDEIPAEELLRVDTCETAYRRLCLVDMVQTNFFLALYLRLALQAGEPVRIALALSAEAALTALGGGASLPRAEAILKKALSLAERLDQPFVQAYTTFMGGCVAWAVGRWKESLALCERAANTVTEKQVVFASERTKMHHFSLDCLMMLGQWREIGRRVPGLITEARRRGDRFSTSAMLVHSYVSGLAAGRPDESEEVLRQALEEWPQKGLFATGYWALYGRGEAALYRGDGPQALEMLVREWSSVARSTFFQHIQILSLVLVHLRARAALAAANVAPADGRLFGQRGRLLRFAARDARRIERRNMPWANPLARLIRAGIAAVAIQKEEALKLLAKAEAELIAADMELYAAAARRRRGQLLGGDEGRVLVGEADAWMTGQDIREPARIAAMLAPGFVD